MFYTLHVTSILKLFKTILMIVLKDIWVFRIPFLFIPKNTWLIHEIINIILQLVDMLKVIKDN